MNTNALKKFAQDTRKKLLQQVRSRLELVLTTDSAELREKATALKKLQETINATSKEQVVDKVAYTWFNRLMALRFMDANDYQPIGVSVVTPKAGYTLPELLDEAKKGTLTDDLPLQPQRIYYLLDGKIPSSNAQNEAYKELLIAACNHLHKTFPFLFERINDYAELLLPDDLTSEFSIVQDIRAGMSEEDCKEVEIIGWLYQFYISERKDEVFAAKGKVKKEDIPAATQLFTPRWIVEYMVQNTLGKLWLHNKPNSTLRQHMPYFIESPSVESEDYLKVEDIKDITLLDQACGSGHILVYAFELFSKIYEEEGYSPGEIPQLIIEKNLHGFEIDERAAQLAGFALMMKARSYHRRVFRKELKLNILCYEDLKLKMFAQEDFYDTVKLKTNSPLVKTYLEYGYCLAEDIVEKWQVEVTDKKTGQKDIVNKSKTHIYKGNSTFPENVELIRTLAGNEISFYDDDIRNCFRVIQIPLSNRLYQDFVLIKQATNFGSLIQPKSSVSELTNTQKLLFDKANTSDAFLRNQIEQLSTAIHQLIQLARKYHCVVDNPPYMNSGKMNLKLAKYIKKNFPESKSDLMSVFIETGMNSLMRKGILGMINKHEWMFISKYNSLRKTLVNRFQIESFLHLGTRTFPEIGGEVVQNCSFIFSKKQPKKDSVFLDLRKQKSSEDKRVSFIEKTRTKESFIIDQDTFSQFPNNIFAFWVKNNMKECFLSHKAFGDTYTPKQGLTTSDNIRFLRSWSELNFEKIGFSIENRVSAKKSLRKWFPYNKGGENRKWYGNNTLVVNWGNDGQEIKDFREYKNSTISSSMGVAGLSDFFKSSVSWSKISNANNFGSRWIPTGSLFDSNGLSIFSSKDKEREILAFMCSKVVREFLKIVSPTLAIQVGDVKKIPFYFESDSTNIINKLSQSNIDISKIEWNIRETSWDFKKNELIHYQSKDLKNTYKTYCQHWQHQFHRLHQNEEELNRQFIKIYGLEEELTPDVPLKDITLLKQETTIKNGELVFDPDKVMRQFISYAVGCMFGRYSLDKEGLVLANQGETLEDYIKKIATSQPSPARENSTPAISFLPDDDNIIPILDGDWFPDDIVGRFYEFLKVTFGADQFEQNLTFLQKCIGKDLRKYFVKDFYNDHIKRYKKRPIYWLFTSPKGSFSVLIYLHRYTSDTLNQILNGYLKEYRAKLTNHINYLDHQIETGNSSEQTKAAKEKEKTKGILLELQEYEREILYPLATERIALDLDDGVLVNYNKFGKAIKEVKGLNDKKAKAKVRGFDWIDVSEIRD